jgi:ABC-type Mn2+/Zn2+ transport system ATPase subunit
MFSLAYGAFHEATKKPEHFITVVGLNGAGKTVGNFIFLISKIVLE